MTPASPAAAVDADRPDCARRAGIAATVAALATALFLLPWWNRFLGVTLDGYFPFYGSRIAAGGVPYRDFFLHLPPLQALAHAGLETLFGRHLILSRAAGALARIAIAGVLAAWLTRRFRVGTSIVGALAAVWLASGDDTEILDLYNHHALFASIVAGFAASCALSARSGRLRLWFLSGVGAGIALWTKQTIGLGVSAAIPLALLLMAWRSAERRFTIGRDLGAFVAGWSVPAMIVGGWLASRGALGAFFGEVFVDAAASKGPIWTLLLRPWIDPFRIDQLKLPATIGLLGAIAVALLGRRRTVATFVAPRRWLGASVATVAAIAALVLGHGVAGAAWVEPDTLRAAQRVGVFLALFGILPPTVGLTLAALRRRLDGAEQQTLLLALVGAGTGAALALSWPGGEAVSLPSLALVLALAVDAGPIPGWKQPLRATVVTMAALAAVAAVALKLMVPFDFVLWREPPIAKARDLRPAGVGRPPPEPEHAASGRRSGRRARALDGCRRADPLVPGDAGLLLARRSTGRHLRRGPLDRRDAGSDRRGGSRTPPRGPSGGGGEAARHRAFVRGQSELLPAGWRARAASLPGWLDRPSRATLRAGVRFAHRPRRAAAARGLGSPGPVDGSRRWRSRLSQEATRSDIFRCGGEG